MKAFFMPKWAKAGKSVSSFELKNRQIDVSNCIWRGLEDFKIKIYNDYGTL